jgi:hypothetical protein
MPVMEKLVKSSCQYCNKIFDNDDIWNMTHAVEEMHPNSPEYPVCPKCLLPHVKKWLLSQYCVCGHESDYHTLYHCHLCGYDNRWKWFHTKLYPNHYHEFKPDVSSLL